MEFTEARGFRGEIRCGDVELGTLRESRSRSGQMGSCEESWRFSTAAVGVDSLESFTTLSCLGKGGERKWVWKEFPMDSPPGFSSYHRFLSSGPNWLHAGGWGELHSGTGCVYVVVVQVVGIRPSQSLVQEARQTLALPQRYTPPAQTPSTPVRPAY